MRRKADESIEVLKRTSVPQEWIANPIFKNKYDFEQDKVIPLHDLFENLDTDEIKKVIDQFVELNKRLMGIGMIEKSFNITKNYGLNKNGQVVLIDIGELFDKEELISKQIKNRVWNKNYVSGRIKNIEAREYFISEMDKNF